VTLHLQQRARSGRGIPILVRVANTGAGPIELYLRGREPTFDVIVSGPGGDVVWSRLEGEIVQAILRLETLGPGEAMELHQEWDQRDNSGLLVEPGRYTVKAVVLTDGTMVLESPEVALEIVDK